MSRSEINRLLFDGVDEALRELRAAAAWGPFPPAELEELRPDLRLDHPKELLTVFSR